MCSQCWESGARFLAETGARNPAQSRALAQRSGFPGRWESTALRCTCLPASPGIRNPGRAAAFSLQLREPSQSLSGLHPGSFGHFYLSLGEGKFSLKSEICSSNSNNYHCNDYCHFYYPRHLPILISVMVRSSKPIPREPVRVQRSPASEDATSGSGLRRVHFAFANPSWGFIFKFEKAKPMSQPPTKEIQVSQVKPGRSIPHLWRKDIEDFFFK